jgi:predicted lysophospholipase L1 biosynthesis ABC-type transport system permease subunit
MQVVGVVGDVTYHELDAPAVRRVYVPYSQLSLGNPGTLRFIVRSERDPALLADAVRREIAAADPLMAIGGLDPLTRLMRQSIGEQRLVTRLATGFGVLSMLLAAIGLYGVMTYAITRRTGEIGLRVALGAQRADVLRLVLFDAIRIVVIGVVIGIPLAFVTTRLLRSQLHGIGSADPVALGSALFVLSTSTLLAALLPALRATRVAPLVALRQE